MKKAASILSKLFILFATVIAMSPCPAKYFDPPMPEKLRKQLED